MNDIYEDMSLEQLLAEFPKGFVWQELERSHRHRIWKHINIKTLEASGACFTVSNGGENLMFREKGKPKVDFYPSTGRWRVVGNRVSTAVSGGAGKFLEWYNKQ